MARAGGDWDRVLDAASTALALPNIDKPTADDMRYLATRARIELGHWDHVDKSLAAAAEVSRHGDEWRELRCSQT